MPSITRTRSAIAHWYDGSKRDLPWRRTRDPYAIWLSEVILQQTRVDQGMAYWHRFMRRWPDVRSLAEAHEDEVLRAWQGLGYYSRARALLIAARQIVQDHGGKFPADRDLLRRLKGVGDYTSAAIASICFGLPEAVVDGNVYRVLARSFGIATPIDSTEGKKEFQRLADRLLDRKKPGDHNQTMMELGAVICTPKKPKCDECPIRSGCVAYREGRIAELPVKAKRTKVRTRHFNYLFIVKDDRFFLRKRAAKDIWRNMYELPLIETEKAASRSVIAARSRSMGMGGKFTLEASDQVVHLLSHQRIEARFWIVRGGGMNSVNDMIEVEFADLDRFALPQLIAKWLDRKKQAMADRESELV